MRRCIVLFLLSLSLGSCLSEQRTKISLYYTNEDGYVHLYRYIDTEKEELLESVLIEFFKGASKKEKEKYGIDIKIPEGSRLNSVKRYNDSRIIFVDISIQYSNVGGSRMEELFLSILSKTILANTDDYVFLKVDGEFVTDWGSEGIGGQFQPLEVYNFEYFDEQK